MSTTNTKGNRVTFYAAFLLAASLYGGVASAAPETTSEARESTTLHFESGGRSNNRDPSKGTMTQDSYDGLQQGKSRGSSVSKLDGSSAATQQAANFDFWIYEADVILFNDDDNDGYFFGIDLLFDADTIYGAADVYAAVYLSFEGGPWNEYAVTDDFTIFGASANDEYVLVSELMSGYPTGDYDLLIELFDADNGDFLASFGPGDTSELSFLPLEDFNRDAPTETVVVVSRGGGGATGFIMLLALGLIVLRYFNGQVIPERSPHGQAARRSM